jgi:hypothetical protein
VGKARKRNPAKALNLLEKRAESHLSGARCVRHFCVAQDSIIDKGRLIQTDEIIAHTFHFYNRQKEFSKNQIVQLNHGFTKEARCIT